MLLNPDAGEALRIFLLDGTGVKTAAGIGDMNGKQILAHGGTDGDGDKIIFIRRAAGWSSLQAAAK